MIMISMMITIMMILGVYKRVKWGCEIVGANQVMKDGTEASGRGGVL